MCATCRGETQIKRGLYSLKHVVRNRAKWDDLAVQFVVAVERAWAREEPAWGIWQVPEAEVRAFPEKLARKDVMLSSWDLALAPFMRAQGLEGSQVTLTVDYPSS